MLADNYSVLRLLSDSGLVLRRRIGNGVVYAVSPHAGDIEGIACVPSVAALPRRPTWRWWRCRRPRWQGWPVFGPVVVFGLGGIATGVLAGHAARLAPLTGADAEDLLRAIRAAPALLEQALDTGALRDTLLRVSRLADDPP